MKGVVKTLWRTDCRPIPACEVAGSHTGIPHETKVGKGCGLTPPNPRVPCCQDPGNGGWGIGIGRPRTRTPGSREAQAPRACGWGACGSSDAEVPVRLAVLGPSEAPTPQGSPEEFRRPEGLTLGSRAPGAALPAAGPTPRSEAEPERPTAGPGRPCGPQPGLPPGAAPSRPVPVGVPGRQPSPALRGASSPPLLNGAARGAVARPGPTNGARDAPAPGQPSAESPSDRGGVRRWGTASAGEGGATAGLAQTVSEPRNPEQKECRTLQNGFYGCHDSNVNRHIMGPPLGCDRNAPNHRKRQR